jgi:hypothetical protein
MVIADEESPGGLHEKGGVRKVSSVRNHVLEVDSFL